MKTFTKLFYRIFVAICMIFTTTIKTAISQPLFDWVSGLSGGQYTTVTSTTIDIQGNIYTVGYFEGAVDFDPGTGASTKTSVGGTDVYILKLNSQGNFLWVKTIGSSDYDFSTSISLDAAGNIYYSGEFSSTMDFDPGLGVSNLTSFAPSGSAFYDLFFSKLDSNGNFIWAKNIGGKYTGVFQAKTIADPAGNLFITGAYMDDSLDFDSGIPIYYGTANLNTQEIFVAKFDALGSFLWVKFFHGGNAEPNQIKLDAYGNIYSTGSFQGTIDFDPGINTYNLGSSVGYHYYVSKLDNNGNFLWANAVHQPMALKTLNSESIHIDMQGNVYTTGSFQGTIDFDPGNGSFNLSCANFGDIFINKLDGNGNFVWAKQLKGTIVGEGSGYSITSDAFGYIYLTGCFSNTVDFDPGNAIINFASNGLKDIFILQLDNNGSYIMAKVMGSLQDDYGYFINIDGSGNIIISGVYKDICDFDPNVGIFNLSTTNSGSVFIHKMSYTNNSTNDINITNNYFTVFPNPSSSYINIKFSSISNNTIIRIYSITGGLINTYKIFNELNYSIDLSLLSNGVYFVEVESSDFIARGKVAVSK